MKKAAIYMRMSTDKQEHSIESQLRLIRDYAKLNNYEIYHCYSDEGISGRSAEKRPAFLQMIEDSEKNLFDFILIYDSSRFARNLEQSIVYKSLLKKNGVNLISITEPSLDDDTALITDALLGAMNEMYCRKLSKNVKRGMEQKALRGEYLSAPPFGYCRHSPGGTIIKHPTESKIVFYLFEQAINGKSIFSLAKELNEKNIITHRGKPMEKRTILYLLNNPVYKGYLKWKTDGKTILLKANHEPIVSEELFDNLQKLLLLTHPKKHRENRPKEVCRHWLSGMLYCKICGASYVYSKGFQGRKNRFRCGGYLKGICTSSASFTVNQAEDLILSQLEKIKLSGSYTFYSPPPPIPKKHYELKKLYKYEQALLKAKQAYLYEADTLEEYLITKTMLSQKIEAIKNNISDSIASKNHLNSQSISFERPEQYLKSNYATTDKAYFMKCLVEKIIVSAEENMLHIILKQ